MILKSVFKLMMAINLVTVWTYCMTVNFSLRKIGKQGSYHNPPSFDVSCKAAFERGGRLFGVAEVK